MDLGLRGARALVGGRSRGLGAEPIAADLSSSEGPRIAVNGAVDQLGGLDLIVVNTGGPPPGTFDEVTEEQWGAGIDGTLLSTLRLIRNALPHLREAREPAILVVLSSSVREPIPALLTSNVLRPGLSGLIKTLVGEIARVRINRIAPGRIATDRVAADDRLRAERGGITVEEVHRLAVGRIPGGRYGEPTDVGRVAPFLLSPAASYVDGVIMAVDGGMIRSLP